MDVSVEKQTKINEWSYNSKRDTLFFSQLVFIGLSILIIMYWMSSMGLLSDIFVIFVMIIIFVILGVIWYTRYSYTRNNRDKTYWNKLVFPEDGKKPSTLSPTVLNSVAASMTAACSSPSGRNSPSGNCSGTTVKKNVVSITPNTASKTSSNIPSKTTMNTRYSDETWNNIDYGMFEGQKYGFNTKPTGPGSAAVRDASGILYGDTSTYTKDGKIISKSDGRLGIWDTSGDFLDFDDVSMTNLNTRQGLDYNNINAGKISPVSELGNSLEFCKKNPSAYDPVRGMPCKKIWCMANPSGSWKDPATSVTTPCKTLFSYL